jgi:hypothetical protein
MSLDPPPYLGSLQNNIRQRPIPWDGAARAGTITENQLAKIRAVDKVRKEQRKQVVDSDLDGYRILFVGEPGTPGVFETASRRSEVVQYILVLLSDLLQGACPAFHSWPNSVALRINNSHLLTAISFSIARTNSSIVWRCPSSRESTVPRFGSLSTFLTSAGAFQQSRRPYPSTHIDRACNTYGERAG